MATFIHNGEAYINIKEFINVLCGIRLDLEEEYKWCINNSKVIQNEETRRIVDKMVKDDFDLFISKLNLAINNLEKHIKSTLKVGKNITIKEVKTQKLKELETKK